MMENKKKKDGWNLSKLKSEKYCEFHKEKKFKIIKKTSRKKVECTFFVSTGSCKKKSMSMQKK